MLDKKNIKDFGQVKKVCIDITQPITAKYEIEMNSLSLFVGKNGVGKSLMLKII